MRNRNYFKVVLALVVAVFLGLTACKKNNGNGEEVKQLEPVITLDASSASGTVDVYVGDTVTIKGVVTKGKDGAKLKTFEYIFTRPDGSQDRVTKDITGLESYNFDTSFSVGSVEGTLKVEIKVTDKDGYSASTTVTFNIKKQPGPTPPKFEKGLVLTYDVANRQYSNSFLASPHLKVHTAQEAETMPDVIDVAYFYSQVSKGHNLVSPQALTDDQIFGPFAITWGQVATIFRTNDNVTADSIVNLKDETLLEQMFNDGTNVQANCGSSNCDGTRVNNSLNTYITQDKVILFKGAGGKYGALIIRGMSGSGSLNIDVYVQN